MFCTIRCADPARCLAIADAMQFIAGRIESGTLWPCSLTPQGHMVFMADDGQHREALRILRQLGVRDGIEFGDVHGGTVLFDPDSLPEGWQAKRTQARDEIVALFLGEV